MADAPWKLASLLQLEGADVQVEQSWLCGVFHNILWGNCFLD